MRFCWTKIAPLIFSGYMPAESYMPVESQIGLFWLLPHTEQGIALLGHAIPLTHAEEYGACLTDPLSHYDAWGATKRGRPLLTPLDAITKKLIAASEYEEWPRGRVVYDRLRQTFIVYADRQILPHGAVVRAHFALPEDTPFRTDPHYRNTKHLPKSTTL
jgi:hypothetical protein